MNKIDPNRQFQLWEYSVSHGCALVRSPRSPSFAFNIDIQFFGVEYLAVPRHLGCVQVDVPTRKELNAMLKMLGNNLQPERVVVLACGDKRHIVVAAKMVVRKSYMDIFESPFNRRMSEIGVPDNQNNATVLEEHGSQLPGDGPGTVPDGTYLRVPNGEFLDEVVAQDVALHGRFPPEVSSTVLSPGDPVPNLVLHPVSGEIQRRASSTTVTAPTLLCDILEPNMGLVVWAACRARR